MILIEWYARENKGEIRGLGWRRLEKEVKTKTSLNTCIKTINWIGIKD